MPHRCSATSKAKYPEITKEGERSRGRSNPAPKYFATRHLNGGVKKLRAPRQVQLLVTRLFTQYAHHSLLRPTHRHAKGFEHTACTIKICKCLLTGPLIMEFRKQLLKRMRLFHTLG